MTCRALGYGSIPPGGRYTSSKVGGRAAPKRVTLGQHGELAADQARKRAAGVIDRIKQGKDPVPAPAITLADLAERYMRAHVAVNCNAHTAGIYRGSIDNHILPALGALALQEVGREQIAALHYELRNTPRAANRVLMILSKMFVLAEAWGLVAAGDNPCRHVVRYKRRKRERFLTEEEYRRLGRELAALEAEGRVPAPAAAALPPADADRLPAQ